MYLLLQPLVRQLQELHVCSEVDNEGNLPLHLAAEMGNLEALNDGLLHDDIWEDEEVCMLVHLTIIHIYTY